MKHLLFLLLAAIFFSACVNDSPVIAEIGAGLNDSGRIEYEIADELFVQLPDEAIDETAEERPDATVDEEIDTYPDEIQDEYADESIDETPDDDYIFAAPESMVLIPAGSFWMGAPKEEEGRYYNEVLYDEALHYVVLTKGFYIDRYEVTQGEFEALMGYNPSFFGPRFSFNCGADCPVEWVSWHEAASYANMRSEADGLPKCFECSVPVEDLICKLKTVFSKPQDCKGYRLPTESEWEYAARAGTDTAFYYGDMLYTEMEPLDLNLDEIAWYKGNSGTEESGYVCYEDTYCSPRPVGSKLANNFGLYDMSGNVWEWTMDWYREYPYGTEEFPLVDPFGLGDGIHRIIRGGSFITDSFICRSAYRASYGKGDKCDSSIGFRLVKTE